MNTHFRKPEWILFDLGGTLMDTGPVIEAAANRVRERKNLGGVSPENLQAVLSGKMQTSDLLIPDGAGGKERRDALMMFGRYLDIVFPDYARPYPGINQLLSDLRESGVRLCVLENAITLFLHQWLEFAGWENDFEFIAGADSVPFLIPSENLFPYMLARLGTEANKAWYVSDGAAELRAARNSGIRTIGSGYGYGAALEAVADVVVNQPLEIVQLVLKKNP